ncbi:hypothetical protein IYY11_02840 [Methylocystis sp. H62]|nr:hypothetical protein [Methylocystis sp. H62]MBG0800254.1 hypothetical protein [Methylocystis sp. H4A]
MDRAVPIQDEAPKQYSAPEGEASFAIILAFSPLAGRHDCSPLQFRAKGFDGESEFWRNESRVHNEVFAVTDNVRTSGIGHPVLRSPGQGRHPKSSAVAL